MIELDLFAAAIAIADSEKRTALLDRECAGQPELRQRLDQLLAAYFRSAPLSQELAAGRTGAYVGSVESPADVPGADKLSGTVIAGKYTLVDIIGEGGMGSVWRARQTEPVKRFVAVKLIKAGMDSRQVLARFEAERQALALMDHENIAKVFDGGLHKQRPYFVMELVQGVPITEYCDKGRLKPRERLELFVSVCQAIQHAHHKGIIHRDIKPGNVLVARYDDKPIVKVIDFGVAKATGGMLTEQTIDTGHGVVGTAEYMSPEQATLNNLDIDTRSDVYSLGVLLYELLTGSPPFSKKELEKKGLLEMLRVVREDEPPRPSTKLSTAEALPTLSANRGTEPKKLTGLLRNELDWIVMKALEKDRARRYETANGFAADVLRYLSGEAVQAHPPSTAYRLKKFVRRHRGQVLATSLVLIALLFGIVGTSWQWIRAERLATAEKAATALLASIFDGLDIRKVKEGSEKLEDMLANEVVKAGQKLEGKSVGDPLVTARLQDKLGVSLVHLGFSEDAIPLFEKALNTRSRLLGPDHPDTLTSMDDLAYGYRAFGKPDKAVPIWEETLRLRKATLPPSHRDTLQSMNNLAVGYHATRQFGKAVPLFEETLKLRKAAPGGADDPDTLGTMNNLAACYRDAGDQEKALPLAVKVRDRMTAKLGADHPDTLTAMSNLAKTYQIASLPDKALPLWEETLKLQKARLPADHPDTLATMNMLAAGYQAAGQPGKALPLFEDVLKVQKAKLEPDDPATLTTMHNLAGTYWQLHELKRSIPLFEETLRLREKKLGRQHSDTLVTLANLGVNYRDANRLTEAIPLLSEAYTPESGVSLRWVGPFLLDAYVKAGRGADAARLIDELLAQTRRQVPPESPQLAQKLTQFGLTLLQVKEFAKAEPLLRESLAIREKQEPETWPTFYVRSLLGRALLGQKKYAAAEPLLVKGYEGMKQREKSIPPQANSRIPEALHQLIELYTAIDKPDEAKKYKELRAQYPAPKPAENK